jgi:hypothetical protein
MQFFIIELVACFEINMLGSILTVFTGSSYLATLICWGISLLRIIHKKSDRNSRNRD